MACSRRGGAGPGGVGWEDTRGGRPTPLASSRPRAERSTQAAVAPRASYPVMLSSIISERRPADLKCLGRRTWSCPSRYGAMGDETGARLRVLLPFDWPPARSEVQSCTGTKPTASGGKAGRSNASLANGMKGEQQRSKFVLCIRNGGSDDLEVRKVYQVFPDPSAAHDGYVRIIDESGEDYLYPSEYFVPVRLPAAVRKALLISA